ncbi:hypothetical protein Tco_0859730 [Tanacetum coccineum]|uniref:Uncharacterized protein n=1 Tax=Tanacetum coccineum TaxID=301880 RepID=A0ABQ5BFU9_9ASTR
MPHKIPILDGQSLSLLNVFLDKHLLMIAPMFSKVDASDQHTFQKCVSIDPCSQDPEEIPKENQKMEAQ